jgi:hypothetical protein
LVCVKEPRSRVFAHLATAVMRRSKKIVGVELMRLICDAIPLDLSIIDVINGSPIEQVGGITTAFPRTNGGTSMRQKPVENQSHQN